MTKAERNAFRRVQGEENYRRKFEEYGLSDKFEFIRREWSADHDKRFWSRCKTCGAVFLSFNEVFKGRQQRLLCPECGAASDGKYVFARSPKVSSILAYYHKGHSVRETAEKFDVTMTQVNNAVKEHGITNGKDWRLASFESNARRHNNAEKRFYEYLKSGGKDYRQFKCAHKRRAIKFGCEYDPSVTLRALIKRSGLKCAICGEICDPNDHSWSKYCGPLYPTIDHIIPMSKGGGHTWNNVQVAHAICNSLKKDNMEETYEQTS